jgi:succinoglycan biosynthesis transport protein ExoP
VGLHEYLKLLRRNLILLVVMVDLGLGLAVAYSLLRPPTYSATAELFVSTQQASNAQDLSQGGNYAQQVVKNYAYAATTPYVLLPVIQKLGLHTTPARLKDQVSVDAPSSLTLIKITATDGSAVRSAQIANEVSSSLARAVPVLSPSGTGQASPVKIKQVTPAVAPDTPASPNVPLNLGIGLLTGLILGLGIAVIRDVLDTRVRSEADVAAVTDSPILGAIGYDRQVPSHPLIVTSVPHSPQAEAFRSLRTNLQFLGMGKTGQAFVITSPLAGEGKSTTSVNLALAIADAGIRVLLVEADLRRPKLSDYLGIDGGLGLSDVLIGKATLDEALQPWGDRGLSVLPSGQRPPNPSELLQSDEMGSLMGEMRSRFHVVVLDAPPTLPVSDAALLTGRASGAILVCAAKRTNRAQLRAALEVLHQVDAKVVGIVMTMVPRRGPDAKGYTRYGYGYGHDMAAVPHSNREAMDSNSARDVRPAV